jgi:cytochrome b561
MEFLNAEAAFYMTAILMFVSGVVVYIWMEETHPEFGTHEPPAPAPKPRSPTVPQD